MSSELKVRPTKKDVIRDSNGDITRCIQNRYVLGYWYCVVASAEHLAEDYKVVLIDIVNGFGGIVLVLLAPVVPFLRGFNDYRNAVKQMKKAGYDV